MSLYNNDSDAPERYYKERGSKVSSQGGPALPALGHALSGAAGSAFSNVCVYPLSIIITRLQIQSQLQKDPSKSQDEEYTSILDAARKIYEREGISGFFSGCFEDTAKTVADSFLFFLAYNSLRQTRLGQEDANGKMSVPKELVLGMLAAAFGKFMTSPIATVVTRLQTANMKGESNANMSSIIKEIREEKGIQGFWSGYSAYLVLTLNPSLTFLFIEALKRAFVPRDKRDNPPPQVTFLISASSKALASTITYPFSLAKSRLQSARKKTSGGSQEAEPSDSEKATPKKVLEKVKENQPALVSYLVDIVQKDGVLALYDGLIGEVLKGFFNQGITMTLKDMVHVAIIQTYYIILKALRKYPSPEELAQMTKDKVNDALNGGPKKGKAMLNEKADQLRAYPTLQSMKSRTMQALRPYPNSLKGN